MCIFNKKNKAQANKNKLNKPKSIKTPKDLLKNLNNDLSNIQKTCLEKEFTSLNVLYKVI